MATNHKDTKLRRIGRLLPLLVIGGLFVGAFLAASNPLFYSPNQSARDIYYNSDREIFTTFFYWYRSNGSDYATSAHLVEQWDAATISKVNNFTYPSNWPGPTNANDMLVNGYHDAISHHPPADAPQYNATGDVVGTLQTGVMSNITSWFDWLNSSWYEWEFRNMMKAGIDVFMPVDWWNGQQNYWAYEGLQAMVAEWYQLRSKLPAEADVRDPTVTHDVAYAQNIMPKIAMFFDTTCMKQLYCWNLSVTTGIDYNTAWNTYQGPDLKDPYWQQQFWQRIQDFYDVVDNTTAFNFHGSNVVWLYSDGWFSDVGTSVLNYCKAQFLARYGRALLFVGPNGWSKASVDGMCNWGSCCPGPVNPAATGIPVGALGPGYYNIGAVAGQSPIYYSRDVTAYKAKWQTLMNEGATWIHVETWNEYHEGTDISWTQEYGDQWINATREMADIFHQMHGVIPFAGVNFAAVIVPLIGFAALCAWYWRTTKKTAVPMREEKKLE
ncbi:MAG TPA: hypothetical protein VKK79_07815 [Candidatus Lokiarchaeia archaeon]|nr:hypothetical protein [Candidatus Lokiarchaeia archaeon]